MSNIERLCEQLQQLFDADKILKTNGFIKANKFDRPLIAAKSVERDTLNCKELIAKQAEQIKMLREAAILAMPYLFIYSVEDSKAEAALEATKGSA